MLPGLLGLPGKLPGLLGLAERLPGLFGLLGLTYRTGSKEMALGGPSGLINEKA